MVEDFQYLSCLQSTATPWPQQLEVCLHWQLKREGKLDIMCELSRHMLTCPNHMSFPLVCFELKGKLLQYFTVMIGKIGCKLSNYR